MRRYLLSYMLALPLFALGQNPNPNATLDAFIMEEMELENIPGMATIIVKNGEIVWRNGYGLADVAGNVHVTDSTIFALASVSKLFTGTALMQLAEDGQIDLDDPINAHMPFNVVNPNHPGTAITFRMLMTHTSSIQDNEAVMDNCYGPGGTVFQQQVWEMLQQVPFGRTAAYGDLALRLGDAKLTRAVGTANGSNPIAIIISCHRIIGVDGSLTGYAGGLWRKQWLLRHESAQGELF